MRLHRTAQYARDKEFDAFTTTLLVSPYQERHSVTDIGSELSGKLGVRFIDDDWRSGFRTTQQLARDRDMYRQNYCGCIFSEKERCAKARSR